MTLQVGDKAVVIPLRDGGRVTVRSGTIAVGDKAVLIPGVNGQTYAVRPASPAVGDKVVLYPLRSGGYVCLAPAGDEGSSPTVLPLLDFFVTRTSHSTANLKWTLNEGNTAVRILRRPDQYPMHINDGTVVYDGAGTSAEDSGLDYRMPYYYSAWARADARYSSGYLTDYLRLWEPLFPEGEVVAWGNLMSPTGITATQVAAGFWGTGLALRPDGTVYGWGENSFGQASPPAGLVATHIAAGGHHSLAVRSDGRVVGWGQNNFGQLSIPANLTAVQVAAGVWHSVALKEDGSVVAWGLSQDGATSVPAGLRATKISTSYWHTLALRTDGSLVGWGRNNYGQCTIPESVQGHEIEHFATGDDMSIVALANGSIVKWGRGGYWTNNSVDAREVGAGGAFLAALDWDGVVHTWGGFPAPSGLSANQIACGQNCVIAIRK